ncbi:radical SAM protein [candidate division WOR-3 bacterium]|nr:radical SAM protein [candidate division WOR-3 bacterium]
MFLSNLPARLRIMFDPGYARFKREVHELFAPDPNYSRRKSRRFFQGIARGEKIVYHDGGYVVSSYLPPQATQSFFTYIKGGAYQDQLFTSIAYMKRRAPLSAYLCVTNACHFNCVHCSARDPRGKPSFKTAEWIGLIREIQDAGAAVIGFTGGEPALRPDIEELIPGVDSRSATILFTSGKDFTRERAQSFKEAGLDILSVSLDSADPAFHAYMRADENAFQYALNAILFARDAGMYVLVQPVVFKRGLSKEKLFRLFRLVHNHGAHEVRIHQPVPSGTLLNTEDTREIFLTQADRERLFRIQHAANRKLWGFPKVSSFPYTESPGKFGCSAGMKHAYVTSDGELFPCDFLPLSFGNVIKEGFKTVFDRMQRQMGIPKERCWTARLTPHIKGKDIPTDPEESTRICQCIQADEYPRFYRDLQSPDDKLPFDD